MQPKPLHLFAAEVLFLNPDDVPAAAKALAAAGLDLKIDPDATDDWPTAFGFATGLTTLPLNDIGEFVLKIIWDLGGDVVEWNYGRPWQIR
jgi:hypothetical protein